MPLPKKTQFIDSVEKHLFYLKCKRERFDLRQMYQISISGRPDRPHHTIRITLSASHITLLARTRTILAPHFLQHITRSTLLVAHYVLATHYSHYTTRSIQVLVTRLATHYFHHTKRSILLSQHTTRFKLFLQLYAHAMHYRLHTTHCII